MILGKDRLRSSESESGPQVRPSRIGLRDE